MQKISIFSGKSGKWRKKIFSIFFFSIFPKKKKPALTVHLFTNKSIEEIVSELLNIDFYFHFYTMKKSLNINYNHWGMFSSFSLSFKTFHQRFH